MSLVDFLKDKLAPVPSPSEEEFARGRWNIERWALVYLGIRMHPGQVRFANAYLKRTPSRWRAFYMWIMVSAGNRAGKTLALSIIILHACVYRIGLEPPDPKDAAAVARWGKLPFHWWHFAVEQGPAEQVHRDLVKILLGIHEAQKNGCPWSKQVGGAEKIATMSDPGVAGVETEMVWGSKERGEYAWIVLDPELGGGQIHFRSTKAKALGALGQNAHGISMDEAGLEPNLTTLIEDIFRARTLGTGGPLIFISTPSVATSPEFEDLWFTGDPEDDFRKPHRFSMRMSSRENIGYGLDQETFDATIEGMDENWIAQNIDGFFIQAALAWFNATSIKAAYDPSLPEDEAPMPARVYIQALDPGLKDKLWSLVFRMRADDVAVGVHIERIIGKQTTRGIVRLGKRVHLQYEQKNLKGKPETPGLAFIETGVDTTALGGHIFRELLEENDPPGLEGALPGIVVRSVEFGGVAKVKRQMLSDLRAALDEGRLIFPTGGFWPEVGVQLKNYKLLDRKVEQDLVMSLAIIVKLMRSSPRQYSVAPTILDVYSTDIVKPPGDGIDAKSIRAYDAARVRQRQAAAIDGANDAG
jgi:hypothetical protein